MTNFYNENFNILKIKFPKIAEELGKLQDDFQDIEFKDTQDGKVLYYKNQCLDHASKPILAGDKWVEAQRISDNKNIIIFGFGSGYHIESIFKNKNYTGKVIIYISSTNIFKKVLEEKDITNILNKVDNLLFEEDDDLKKYIQEGYDLCIRPQEQALFYEKVSSLKSMLYGKKGLSTLQPRIGLVGPLCGGTLPMVAYMENAFKELHQKYRIFDMSPFMSSYEYAQNFVFDKIRKKIIAANYVEVISNSIVESVREKPIDILICLAQAPISKNALKQIRSMGVITALWFVEDYIRFDYWKQYAEDYDFIFTIQKGDCINEIKKAGAGYVSYLPVACDPSIHKKQFVDLKEQERWGSPISFVGAGYHNRQQLFATMCELPFKLWGTEWPTCKPFDRMVQEGGRRLTPEEYIKIFNSSKININLHSSTERDGIDPEGDFVNPRTVELAASEAFQLVDKRSLLPEMFEEGKEVITFSSRDELISLIDYYLEHEDERENIIKNAKARALKDHTYVRRVEQMLSVIYSQKYEYLKNRFETSPWKKLIQRAKPHKELEERVLRAYDRGEEPNLDALVSDIVTGNGDLTETEQKLLFLHHIKSQMIRMDAQGRKVTTN